MSAEKPRIEDAAAALGIELLPWQREIGQRILDGEHVVMAGGRRAGRATLRRVLDKARGAGEEVQVWHDCVAAAIAKPVGEGER